jgi:hypothetical protein
MKDIALYVSPAVVLVSFIWAIWKFGLFRERSSFLRIGVTTTTITHSGPLALVLATVRLENLSNIRIDARSSGRSEHGFLYDDGWDKCAHAGTLKLRRIPGSKRLQHFSWYSLKPIVLPYSLDIPQTPGTEPQHDLEQINYLDEYQDPQGDYHEVHFWLEPKEAYDLGVFFWLPPGSYAAKVFFLGRQTKHADEEYWTHNTMFVVPLASRRRAAVHA